MKGGGAQLSACLPKKQGAVYAYTINDLAHKAECVCQKQVYNIKKLSSCLEKQINAIRNSQEETDELINELLFFHVDDKSAYDKAVHNNALMLLWNHKHTLKKSLDKASDELKIRHERNRKFNQQQIVPRIDNDAFKLVISKLDPRTLEAVRLTSKENKELVQGEVDRLSKHTIPVAIQKAVAEEARVFFADGKELFELFVADESLRSCRYIEFNVPVLVFWKAMVSRQDQSLMFRFWIRFERKIVQGVAEHTCIVGYSDITRRGHLSYKIAYDEPTQSLIMATDPKFESPMLEFNKSHDETELWDGFISRYNSRHDKTTVWYEPCAEWMAFAIKNILERVDNEWYKTIRVPFYTTEALAVAKILTILFHYDLKPI